MNIVAQFFIEVWHILLDSSFYILIGIIVAGVLKVTLNANTIIRHLGQGRFASVVKASVLGVPLPL